RGRSGRHVKAVERGDQIVDEVLEESLPLSLRLAEHFLARVHRVGFAALPAIQIFLSFFFYFCELIVELFELRLQRAYVAELVFRFEVNIFVFMRMLHGGVSITKRKTRLKSGL